jgi:hypothetical protein
MALRFAFVSFPALAVALSAASCSSSPGGSSPSSSTSAGAGAAEAGVEAAAGTTVMADGCPANSGFAGDALCLAPPSSTDGFQLRYGPRSYDSADEQPYVNAPGVESIDCYYLKTPNTTDVYVGGFEFQMRPGSHHLNVNINPMAQADGFATCGANDMSPGLLYGTQTPVVDERHDPAPENQGLAVHLPANSQAVINFHVINVTSKSMLREAWLNYYYMDPSEVKGYRGNLFLVGGVGAQITPGTHQTYTYSCSPDRPVRILSMAAHMHAYADRMTAWTVTDGQANLVYETYDWSTPTEILFDSVHANTMPDPAAQTPGGATGDLILQPTDSLQWECDVNNTSATTLTFRNEVYTGEMCIMTGAVVPADDPMNPYDFTCTRN